MTIDEDSYGLRLRFEFISQIISSQKPKYVLDYGCGTGACLTSLLAQTYPTVEFLGFDSDLESISFAQNTNSTPNLFFTVDPKILTEHKFDLVILSEVLEHLEEPESFLLNVRNLLSEPGLLLVTIPNGYGIFELLSFFYSLLFLTGIYSLFRKVLRAIIKSDSKDNIIMPTLAHDSVHINFFSFKEINAIFSRAGFHLLNYQGRTFACGFIISEFIDRNGTLLSLNSFLGRKLPPPVVSGWMFLLTKINTIEKEASPRQRLYPKIRRFLNLKLCNSKSNRLK